MRANTRAGLHTCASANCYAMGVTEHCGMDALRIEWSSHELRNSIGDAGTLLVIHELVQGCRLSGQLGRKEH